MICNRTSCGKEATRKAVFVLYAPRSNVTATAELSLVCCEEHATAEAGRELIESAAGRKQIEQMFASVGRALPDWERSYAKWVPLGGASDAGPDTAA